MLFRSFYYISLFNIFQHFPTFFNLFQFFSIFFQHFYFLEFMYYYDQIWFVTSIFKHYCTLLKYFIYYEKEIIQWLFLLFLKSMFAFLPENFMRSSGNEGVGVKKFNVKRKKKAKVSFFLLN